MSKLEDSLFAEFTLFGIPVPERQFKFHPKRKWLLDFAWPDLKIAVEVQGGIYISGQHSRGAEQEKEYEKLNEATKLGWRVYLFGPRWLASMKRGRHASLAVAFLADLMNP